MPTYEYQCEKGCNFEVFQKFNASNPESCPKCGSLGIERQFSIPSIIYKGSGFYSTDYGSSKSRNSDSSESKKEKSIKKDQNKENNISKKDKSPQKDNPNKTVKTKKP